MSIIIDLIIVILGYLILLSTSGLIVKFILRRVEHEKGQEIASKAELDTGFIIGKCENILIVSLVLVNAYTALALIFTAKTIIRAEDIKKNSLYYLAGTMINVTYSIIFGIIIKTLISL
jgi:hypothetical protein